jgi:hypothetical protein
MKVSFKEAYHNYLKMLGIGKLDVQDFDLVALLEIATEDYLNSEVLGLDLDNPDRDMLLFEYGNYDWTGEGVKFNLSIKRQLFFKELDECGYYGFTVYFDTVYIGPIQEYSKWCENKRDAKDWLVEIKNTEGIQKVLGKSAMKFEVTLDKPH